MKGIIDRFEGDYAVVEFEGRKMMDIHKRDLPSGSMLYCSIKAEYSRRISPNALEHCIYRE